MKIGSVACFLLKYEVMQWVIIQWCIQIWAYLVVFLAGWIGFVQKDHPGYSQHQLDHHRVSIHMSRHRKCMRSWHLLKYFNASKSPMLIAINLLTGLSCHRVGISSQRCIIFCTSQLGELTQKMTLKHPSIPAFQRCAMLRLRVWASERLLVGIKSLALWMKHQFCSDHAKERKVKPSFWRIVSNCGFNLQLVSCCKSSLIVFQKISELVYTFSIFVSAGEISLHFAHKKWMGLWWKFCMFLVWILSCRDVWLNLCVFSESNLSVSLHAFTV